MRDTGADRRSKTLSVFVPAYNEARGLEPAVRGILAAADEVLDACEVLIVNDGSTDGTGELADRLAREDSRIVALHQPRNLGLKAGYERALARARYEFFTFVPGDNEMSPVSVRNILEMVGTADVVVPFHFNTWARQWHRRLMTFVCTTLLNSLLGNRLKYYQGPNVYPTDLARILPRTCDGFFFLTEMTAYAVRMGCRVRHARIIHQERKDGVSKAVSMKAIGLALKAIFHLWYNLRVRNARLPLAVTTRQPSGKDAELALCRTLKPSW